MSTQLPERMEAFVESELRAFAQLLYERLRTQVQRRNITEDRELLQSLAWQAARTEFGISFADQGRFHDMGAGRGYRKGQYIGEHPEENHRGHKPSKFYSRTAWGSVYGTLVNNLMNKYTEAVLTDMKDTIGKPTT